MKWKKAVLDSTCLEIGSDMALFLPVTFIGIVMASLLYSVHGRVRCLLEVGPGSLSLMTAAVWTSLSPVVRCTDPIGCLG